MGQPLPQSGNTRLAAASQDGAKLATCEGQTVRLWRAATGEALRSFATPGPVDALALDRDGRTAVTADRAVVGRGFDTVIRRWDTATAKQLATTCAHQGKIEALALSPDGGTIAASLALTKGVHAWNAATGAPRGLLLATGVPCLALEFSADGAKLLVGSQDRTARVWDVVAGQPVGPPLRHGDKVWSAEFSPDGRRS